MSNTITLNREQAEAVRRHLVLVDYLNRIEELQRAADEFAAGAGGDSFDGVLRARANLDEAEHFIGLIAWGDEVPEQVQLPAGEKVIRDAILGAFDTVAELLHDLTSEIDSAEATPAELARRAAKVAMLAEVLDQLPTQETAVA